MKRKSKNIITFDCYDKKSNTCDGRCQGCSDCLLVTKHQISKKKMRKYMKQVYIINKYWERLGKILEKDAELNKKLKEMINNV